MTAATSRVTTTAIPSQFVRPLAVPQSEIDRALTALLALSRELGTRSLLACTRPDPISATWQSAVSPPKGDRHDPQGMLVTIIDDHEAWRVVSSPYRVIHWRWTVILEYPDGWFDLGWNPCPVYCGLSPPWKARLDRALLRRS